MDSSSSEASSDDDDSDSDFEAKKGVKKGGAKLAKKNVPTVASEEVPPSRAIEDKSSWTDSDSESVFSGPLSVASVEKERRPRHDADEEKTTNKGDHQEGPQTCRSDLFFVLSGDDDEAALLAGREYPKRRAVVPAMP